jgi:hypothetical protein
MKLTRLARAFAALVTYSADLTIDVTPKLVLARGIGQRWWPYRRDAEAVARLLGSTPTQSVERISGRATAMMARRNHRRARPITDRTRS